VKALILGASGQVGQALARAAPSDVRAVALRREDCDIASPSEVRRAMKRFDPDFVFNAAAYTAVDRAESEEDVALSVNATAPRTIAVCAHACGARLVHLSTDFVFDGTASRPYRPEDSPNPLNVYGRTKYQGELGVIEAAPGALIVRTAWVYAVGGRNFVTTMLRLMKEGGSVRIVDDQIGTPTSADSLAGALWKLANSGASGIHHYTDAGVASWYDFGVAVSEEAAALGLIDSPREVVPIATADFPTDARRPPYSVLDKSQTWAALGECAPHWRVGLRAVLKEVDDNG
jgi:dTDP-4-dehydrorhamnose reductase